MTSREKLQRAMDGDRVSPDWEFAYWYSAVTRWYGEGLPSCTPLAMIPRCQFVPAEACPVGDGVWGERYYPADVSRYFGLDERMHSVGVELGPVPAFPSTVLAEDDETVTLACADGKVIRTRHDGASMPHYLSYPVKTPADWGAFRERLDPWSPDRHERWRGRAATYRDRTFPLQLGGGAFSGLYSTLRELLGVEESLTAFYTEPDLCRDILAHHVEFLTRVYEPVLREVAVEFVLFWEDMAFKTGPLVSPPLFREFLLPCYRTLVGRLREMGVRHFVVDTDGNFEAIEDLFFEAGVDGFYPFEAAAGMDAEAFRRRHPRSFLMGGVDKQALARSHAAIDAEIAKVERVLSTGGYVPVADHMVPPDVDFAAFSYYRRRLAEALAEAAET